MAISIGFSVFIYVRSTREFDRILRIQREHMIPFNPTGRVFLIPSPPDEQVAQDAQTRAIESLIEVNSIILALSAVSGYFLAGRTLRPIQHMLDEQNRFITDASHELNTPLTSLRTTIEVNLRDKSLPLIKAKQVLQSNLEDVEKLQALSEELMQLTQYEKANGSIQFTQLPLITVIQAAIDRVAALAEKKHIAIVSSVRSGFAVYGNERSLVELFVILLDNAIKYSPEKKTIQLHGKKYDGHIAIQVADEGFGISEEDVPNIFDRFYRADKSRTKQTAGGYGLGLSIAKRIVEMHHGSVKVKSELGKGTEFTVMLPDKT
ncbi:MAG TPA: HAMP domain-containing sensor histidine kinase [Patescibacteria group bacterium]|nr:HAMP domain-containing sensor histidine kinase [Patescibacteria group bacterium]